MVDTMENQKLVVNALLNKETFPIRLFSPYSTLLLDGINNMLT